MVGLSRCFQMVPLGIEEWAQPGLEPTCVPRGQPSHVRVCMIGQPRHASAQQVMFHPEPGWPHIGRHALSGTGEPVQGAPGEADVPPYRHVPGGGLKVFNRTGQHRTALRAMLFHQSLERCREKPREDLETLGSSCSIWRNIRNQGRPRPLCLG